jgi:hypothetical protein
MVVSATFGVLKTQRASERAVFKCMPLTCIYVVAVKYVWKRKKKKSEPYPGAPPRGPDNNKKETLPPLRTKTKRCGQYERLKQPS